MTRLMNAFKFVPKHTAYADLPPSTYTIDERKVLLWLARRNEELFLVNDSGETLDYVSLERGGFVSDEDGAYVICCDKYEYEKVRLGEAVKVDEYDIYDKDFVIQYSVTVKSKGLGKLGLFSDAEKGGMKDQCVLIWHDL